MSSDPKNARRVRSYKSLLGERLFLVAISQQYALVRSMQWMDNLCWWVVTRFPNRHIIIYVEDRPYLLRFYIKRNGRLPGIYLHRFLSGDLDRDLHNHPWKKSYSLILYGKYKEERYDGSEIMSRVLSPGNVNVIRYNDFHRIDLITKGVWTLFVSGDVVQAWGFKNRDTGKFTHWKTYLESKNRETGEFDND